MRRPLLRALPLALLLALTGCQLLRPDPAAGLTGVPAVQAHYQAGNLEQATELFQSLPPLAQGLQDAERDTLRQQLTEAWMRRGHAALKRRDLSETTEALGHIRALQPQGAISLDALRRQSKGL